MTDPAERVVLVVDPATGRVVERCVGPDPDGSCPRVATGEIVECAGQDLLVLEGPGLDGRHLEVRGEAGRCPLRS